MVYDHNNIGYVVTYAHYEVVCYIHSTRVYSCAYNSIQLCCMHKERNIYSFAVYTKKESVSFFGTQGRA